MIANTILFRNKLLQSEAMSSAAIKRARAISRVAMSPGAPEEDTAVSLIELAKLDLRKEKQKVKKGKVLFVLLIYDIIVVVF